jgi:DNA polymerase-3 subunit delta'
VTATALLERLAARPDRFPGTLLLAGPDASRLEAEARRLAALLLCPGNDPKADCGSCRRVLASLHPDLLLVSPEGVQIRVDRIREAILFGSGRPYESARRVAIVTQTELLGLEAANALLKSLEEPGRHVHWILTTSRPEALPPTILSRCAVVSVPAATRAERLAAARSLGLTAEDAEDLTAFSRTLDAADSAELERLQKWRAHVLDAMEAALSSRAIAPLLLLAEELGRAEPSDSRILAELLADAAVVAAAAGDVVRHRAVAGATRELARRFASEALRQAALRAADAPPDIRRGNRRLHFEKVLLQLYFATE